MCVVLAATCATCFDGPVPIFGITVVKSSKLCPLTIPKDQIIIKLSVNKTKYNELVCMLRTLHPLKFLDIKFWFLIFNFWPEKLSGLSRYEPQQLYKTGLVLPNR